MPESDLIAACIQLIILKGGVPIRVNSGVMVIKDDQGNATRVFKGAGKGTSDILACYRGYFLAIECKMPKNKPTAEQEMFLDSVGAAGGIGIVVWDMNTLKTLLEKIDKLTPFLDHLISRDEFYRTEKQMNEKLHFGSFHPKLPSEPPSGPIPPPPPGGKVGEK